MKNKILIILITIILFKIIGTILLIPYHEELKKYEEKAANIGFDTAQLIELSQNDLKNIGKDAKVLLPGTKIENNSEFISGEYQLINVVYDDAILNVNGQEYIVPANSELTLNLNNTDQVLLKSGYLIYHLNN